VSRPTALTPEQILSEVRPEHVEICPTCGEDRDGGLNCSNGWHVEHPRLVLTVAQEWAT